jgi:uncharacterized membrane-anchored protein
MKRLRGIIIIANLLILLGLFNNSVFDKEVLLSDGQLVLLELAPVDPRSLMQGDYMNLRYVISENINRDSIPKRGFCIVKLEDDGVAKKVRLQENLTPVNNDEYSIAYTSVKWRGINIGAESFFFQEGTGKKYEEAKYGGLKIDNKGNSLLVGLYDENRKLIE